MPLIMANHPCSISALREQNPALFDAPGFWPSQNAQIEALCSGATVGKAEILGHSAGDRPIHAVSYGDFEPVESTATRSSAMASDRPQSFFDPGRRTKPVLALIGSIHGGETEGIALCLNLLHIMETGCDLRGREQPQLLEKMRRVRLLLVPCLNPDGREAAAVAHLNGAELEELFFVQQGLLADGSLFRGRKVKETQPIPPGMLEFMGGYYNAAGVNLQHDDFFGPQVAPENGAIRSLFQREIPDAFITFHAHGAPAAVLTPDAYLSPGCQRKQIEAAGFILAKLHAAGIPFLSPDKIVTPPWSFFFQTWLYQMTGATPLLFEFCHGLDMRPYPLEAILESGLVTAEAWLDYCLIFGARTRSEELFGDIAPA